MKKIVLILLGFILLLSSAATAASPPVRVKDIAHVLQARENQLMGFGLVVGLRNSGDSKQTGFTKQALINLLSKMGVVPQLDFSSRNVAAVMVTCNLPPFLKSGQKIDVIVSSMGDATSLKGGTLLLTPLLGADGQVYAVAQGKILVSEDALLTNMAPIRVDRATSGHIPGGALVEKEVPVTMLADAITIVLDEPDFTTAYRMAAASEKAGFMATAEDAGTVRVAFDGVNLVKTLARVENVSLVPDSAAKVVINERTGTVVIGENVRLAEAAVTFGGLSVMVGAVDMYSEGGVDDVASLRTSTKATVDNNSGNKLVRVARSATLRQLVTALNAVKASPKDIVSILQALKKAGALKAELEII
ncbi:MAG: flagellar basal body P-ring protein FlgI [Candidatus Margulisiibacteriota bacterium]